MSNPLNHGHITGRLAKDPKVFNNDDGSKKVLFTIMVDRNYKNGAGEREADAVPVEAFVSARIEGVGPYGNIHRGDLVQVAYALRMDRYMKNGGTVYDLKVKSEDIAFLESRSVTQTRLSNRAKAAEAQTKASEAEAPAATVEESPVADEQLPFGTPKPQPADVS